MAGLDQQPLLACRSVVARVALSEPDGWVYFAFDARLDNLGRAPAYGVSLDLYPVSHEALRQAGCRIRRGATLMLEPSEQIGDPTLIELERDLEHGLHAQHLGHGDIPPSSFAIGMPRALLDELPPGWLPLFETERTSRDLDRPGVWECGLPSDQVVGLCRYAWHASKPDAVDHYVALPFGRIYVPAGWTPPPSLVDTDGN